MTTINFEPVLYKGGGDDELWSRPDELYWLVTEEGIYAHKPMLIGQAVMPHKPTHLKSIGHRAGYINYTFPPLPATIIAQALDFFRRTWHQRHTEAAVLITYNPDKNDVKLFVPPQRVSGGGVSYGFDPAHIRNGYVLVGSIHSHCNFSAFHSGTDTHDADSFDGLHITIGHVDAEKPDFAAMVSVNRSQLTKKPDEVADLSNLTAAEAPLWWDRYIIDNAAADTPIVKTWLANRPPDRPTYQNTYRPASVNPGTNRPYGSIWDDDESEYWRRPYTPPTNQSHPPVQRGPQHGYWTRGRWHPFHQPPTQQTTKPANDPKDNGDDADLLKALQKRMGQNTGKKRQGSIDQPDLLGLINDFYMVIEDLEEAGLYASDLAEIGELIRAEDLADYITDIAPTELLPKPEPQGLLPDGLSKAEPYLCGECAMPGGTHTIGCTKAQVPGQTTLDEFTTRRYT